MKKIVLFFILGMIFTSCGKEDTPLQETTEKKSNIITKIFSGEDETNSGEEQKVKIKYDEKNEILDVGGITIQKGFPTELDKVIPLYKDAQTYTNSNVPGYIFFASTDELSDIYNYYKIQLKNTGWKLENENEELSNHLLFSKDDTTITISLTTRLPKNIKDLGLEGNFVEVFYQ